MKGIKTFANPGDRFGRWTIISLAKPDIGHNTRYLCKCECGTERVVVFTLLNCGRSLSCGCYQKDLVSKLNRKDDKEVALKRLYANQKKNAKRRGIEFGLAREEFYDLVQQNCYYCGSGPSNGFNEYKATRHNPFLYSGLDRIENTKGYIPGNVAPCCKHCNLAKLDRTEEEFRKWIKRVYNHLYPPNYYEG